MDEEEGVMLLEEDGIHTAESPYCWDLTCWCHTNVDYHGMVMYPVYLDGDVEQAYNFYGVVR